MPFFLSKTYLRAGKISNYKNYFKKDLEYHSYDPPSYQGADPYLIHNANAVLYIFTQFKKVRIDRMFYTIYYVSNNVF